MIHDPKCPIPVPSAEYHRKWKRFESLMPLVDGLRTPKWIRVYDDGGPGAKTWDRVSRTHREGTADRYTVVFTGHYAQKTGGRNWYFGMSADPYHPQGVGTHGEQRGGPIDRPTYSHLGRKIKFADLPENCQKMIVDYYTYLWDIREFLKLPPKD